MKPDYVYGVVGLPATLSSIKFHIYGLCSAFLQAKLDDLLRQKHLHHMTVVSGLKHFHIFLMGLAPQELWDTKGPTGGVTCVILIGP